MGTIDLADVNIAYEGEMLSVIDLVGKLRGQLNDASARLAAVTTALGDLQTTLVDSHTVELKLTLSTEDYGRIKSLAGVDDNDRIRKVIMSVIHPAKADNAYESVECRAAEEVTEAMNNAAQLSPQVEHFSQAYPHRSENKVKKKLTTSCPKCQAPIDLPDDLNDQWPVEVKCSKCGVKCLAKSKSASGVRN